MPHPAKCYSTAKIAPYRVLLAVALMAPLFLAAGAVRANDTVMVFAASSLTSAVTEIGDRYRKSSGQRVRLSFAASSALARQIAMYLTHTVFGFTYSRVAAAFRRDRTTVSHACRLIEDHRDDTAFDALMERLEITRSELPGLSGQLKGQASLMRGGEAVFPDTAQAGRTPW